MARQMVEALVDDLDGSEAVETVAFGLDGKAYKLDLNKKNAAALRKLLARYVEAVPRAGRSSRAAAATKVRSAAKKKSTRGYDVAELREWAGANKIPIPARGRIPRAVVDEFLTRTN